MTRMTGPDCAVMCNLINTHTHTQKSSPWSKGIKTPFGRKERTMYSPYKEKAEMVQKILGKSDISKNIKRNTCSYRGACISKDD